MLEQVHYVSKKLFMTGLLASMALLTGCASMYVDTATKEVPVTEFKQVANPKPVNVVFEFQTKGVPNSRATAFLKDQVIEQVKASQLFTVENGGSDAGMLNITLNNMPITEDAAAKGFVTGLTFGLAGSTVSDGYICTISYLAPGQTQPIVKTARHAIHTTVGNATPPAGVVKAANAETAVRSMTREVVSNALNDLSHDQQFD